MLLLYSFPQRAVNHLALSFFLLKKQLLSGGPCRIHLYPQLLWSRGQPRHLVRFCLKVKSNKRVEDTAQCLSARLWAKINKIESEVVISSSFSASWHSPPPHPLPRSLVTHRWAFPVSCLLFVVTGFGWINASGLCV